MQKLKISQVAELLEIPHSKAKRYTRELLPPDPDATLQSGRARLISEKDAYLIFLIYHLVSDLNFSAYEAKIIIKDLKDWFLDVGLYPDQKGEGSKFKSTIRSWNIHIFKTNIPFSFEYEVEGVISLSDEEKLKAEPGVFRGTQVIQKKYIIDRLPYEKFRTRQNSDEPIIRDELFIRIFKISYLTEIFKLKISGKNIYDHVEDWYFHKTPVTQKVEGILREAFKTGK